jgi:hypothetical protein
VKNNPGNFPNYDEPAPAATPQSVDDGPSLDALDRELAIARAERAEAARRSDAVLMHLAERAAPPRPPAAPQIPSVDADPIGHIIETQKQLSRRIEEHQRGEQQRQQVLQGLAAQQALVQRAQQAETQFKTETPDYDQAVTYLMNARRNELRAIGTPEENITATIQQEGLTTAALALQGNRNPAKVIYELAKARGFAAATPGEPSPQTQEIIRQGRGSPAPSTGRQRMITPESLARMDDISFAAAVTTPEGRAALGADISRGEHLRLRDEPAMHGRLDRHIASLLNPTGR